MDFLTLLVLSLLLAVVCLTIAAFRIGSAVSLVAFALDGPRRELAALEGELEALVHDPEADEDDYKRAYEIYAKIARRTGQWLQWEQWQQKHSQEQWQELQRKLEAQRQQWLEQQPAQQQEQQQR